MTRLTINGKPLSPQERAPIYDDYQWRKLGAAICGLSAVIVLAAVVLLVFWVLP